MKAKLTKNPASFTAWSIERNKERRLRRLQSVPTEAQYKIGRRKERKKVVADEWKRARRGKRLQTL
jgi:hypothetical protein